MRSDGFNFIGIVLESSTHKSVAETPVCLSHKLGGSGDRLLEPSPYVCLISRSVAIPPEHALSSNGKRANSTCGFSGPRLSSIAPHVPHDPSALTASIEGLPALKVA